MKRAVAFYERILQSKVVDAEKGLFIINGIRLCMYDYRKYSDKVVYGNNCVPCFSVDNFQCFFDFLQSLNVKIILQPIRIEDGCFLEFEDSEGNIIKVYSK